MDIKIHQNNNGFVVFVKDKENDLEYSYKAVDALEMLEKVGALIWKAKVQVTPR